MRDKLTPMDELNAMIEAGWGDIPQDQIPEDWWTFTDAERRRRRTLIERENAAKRALEERKRKAERQSARDRWRRTRQPAELRRRQYLEETGRL